MARSLTLEGLFEPAFEEVARTLVQQVHRVGGGAAVCVYFRGRKVVDVWTGKKHPDGARWEADTLAMSFSTTKGVTATALHVLADRRKLDYDDPVAKHWPEFARNGKSGVTIRHVLSHRAGLHNIRDIVDCGECVLDWGYMVRALERAAPANEPGAYPAYHGLTYGWLVGEIVQRVSGRSFPEFVREELMRPLGLDGLYVGAPPEVCARAAAMSRPLPLFGQVERFRTPARLIRGVSRLMGVPVDLSFLRDALLPATGADALWHPDVLSCSIPAANGLFTARSLARLYAALAAGGEIDGVRLLSRETTRRATEVQTRQRDRVLLFRPNWRLGYHGVFTTRGGVPGGFGHFGFGGSGAWADPKRQLAVGFVNNRAGGTPLGDLRILQIGAAAVRCTGRVLAGSAAVLPLSA